MEGAGLVLDWRSDHSYSGVQLMESEVVEVVTEMWRRQDGKRRNHGTGSH